MRRSLIHFWQIHLAVLLGAAVATAVLTGALLVGDSVRGSLRDLTLDRLGQIDHVMLSDRFFRETLAADLATSPETDDGYDRVVPAMLLSGSAVNATTKTRASRVQIQGIDDRFLGFWPSAETGESSAFLKKGPGQLFPSVVINQSLQKELNVEVGGTLLISFQKQNEIHPEFLLGRRDTLDVLQTLRLSVSNIIPDSGVGRFGLHPRQSLPFNAYVSLPILQKALNLEAKVNSILISSPGIPAVDATGRLRKELRRFLTLNDFGLTLRRADDHFSLETSQFVLKPSIIKLAKSLAAENEVPVNTVMTYLANEISANGKSVPYSTITALGVNEGMQGDTGEQPENQVLFRAAQLGEGEILLNEWAAGELKAQPGDRIDISYYVIGHQEQYLTRYAQFRLAGVVPLSGLAADRELTPKFPGVHDADDMSEWDAPFPVDFSRIRREDEAYWDEFGATPKAFVSAATGDRLWSSRFGSLTAIRFGATQGKDLDTTQKIFLEQLLKMIYPEQIGFEFQPVKAQGLEAATGATDFSMLFLGFSLFLIVSASLLVGLLFRLGVEGRAGEIGVLLTSGYPLSRVRWHFMREGGIIAAIGGAIGVVGAIGYAWLMMAGLRTWWVAAVGTQFLSLHVGRLSLLFGYLISVIVVLASIGWTVRRLGKISIRSLVSGATELEERAPGRVVRIVAIACTGIALALLLYAFVGDMSSSPGLFFAVGTLLLIAGFSFLSLWLKSHSASEDSSSRRSIARLGVRNCGRRPGRSILCAALVGCACFVIVAVGANRHVNSDHGASPERTSGTGGFSLVAEADIPLHHDLNSEAGRFELGFSDRDEAAVAQSQIIPLRLLPGEDASCLNLYQPQNPRILGVPENLISRGGFQFQSRVNGEGSPWQLLHEELGEGVVPAVGDYNSVMWILHLGLGEDLVMPDELGEPLKLRLAGFLQGSIFQSELLISEDNFTKYFPSQSGYRYFLIQTPPDESEEVTQALENVLRDHGFDVTSTAEKLANYRIVENTYLSTFQTLGGFGLLLGTLGLGLILLRNAIERRGELATLRAFGFRRLTLSVMLLIENAFLLLTGMAIGTISALIAVGPRILAPGSHVPWTSLAVTLGIVFLIAMIASAAAVYFVLRAPLLPALKTE
jgi:ABC-type antimicrobial peptide transport system permease subunit